MKNRSSIVLFILLFCLVSLLYVPAVLDGGAVSVSQIRLFLPHLCVFFGAVTLGILFPKHSGILFAVSLFAFCIYESLIGFLQIFRIVHSNHELFCLTGTLENPGPFGGLIAICMAVALPFVRRKDWLRYPAIASFALGALILPASMSRAAWLAFAVAVLVFGVNELDWKAKLKSLNRVWYIVVLAVGVAGAVGAFVLKPVSAMGRFHIWHIYALSILKKPFSGWGLGYRGYAYGQMQAEYYSSAVRSDLQISMANCPVESFNEYLSLGVEGGIPAFVLAVAVAVLAVVVLWKKSSPFAYGLICLLVFALFSYPLAVPHLAVPLTVMFAVACVPEHQNGSKYICLIFSFAVMFSVLLYFYKTREYVSSRNAAEVEFQYVQMCLGSGSYDSSARSMESLMPYMSDNTIFLYTYGQTLHVLGRYGESNAVLSLGADISCDPVFHVLMGQNYEAIGNYAEAESEYIQAINMVPCRLLPRCLLMEMKVRQGKFPEAVDLAEDALRLPVNTRHKSMEELHRRIRNCADTLDCSY